MLIPFAGGAEKVVVTLLTMVMCPLYIPSIWGLFSKRLTGNQLISAMILTWLVGIMARVIIPASVISPSLIAVSYTHLRAHETDSYLVCRLLLEKKKKTP